MFSDAVFNVLATHAPNSAVGQTAKAHVFDCYCFGLSSRLFTDIVDIRVNVKEPSFNNYNTRVPRNHK